MREQLSITDFRGKEIGYLNVSTLVLFLFSLIRYVFFLQIFISLLVGRSCAIKRQRKRDHWRWWHIYWWSQTAGKSWSFLTSSRYLSRLATRSVWSKRLYVEWTASYTVPSPLHVWALATQAKICAIEISYTKLWLVRIALSLHICCGWP